MRTLFALLFLFVASLCAAQQFNSQLRLNDQFWGLKKPKTPALSWSKLTLNPVLRPSYALGDVLRDDPPTSLFQEWDRTPFKDEMRYTPRFVSQRFSNDGLAIFLVADYKFAPIGITGRYGVQTVEVSFFGIPLGRARVNH